MYNAEKIKVRQPWEQRSSHSEGNMSSTGTWRPTSTTADIDVHRCDRYPGATTTIAYRDTVSYSGSDVSCGGDMKLYGVDTVLPGAVSGSLCELDRVSGGYDTDVSGVDTVVSGADTDRMSRGDIVVTVDEMSLSGGGDAVVSGVDESVRGVNSVLAAGVLDLCGVYTVVSGVDEPVWRASSVMTAGVLEVCG